MGLFSMKRSLLNKLKSDRGINRLVFILLILVIVLMIVAAIPVYRAYKLRADQYGCTVARKKAQDMLDVEFLGNYSLSYEEAIAVVERSKWEQDALCPAGGDYYLVERKDSDQIYLVTCGLHEKDTRLRTRLNAFHVYELLEEAMSDRTKRGLGPAEEGYVFTVNSQPLSVVPLKGDNGLRWGTSASIDFDGVVCFYSLSPSGALNWFVYADENHAAVWRLNDGWTGDAYRTD